MERLAVTSLVRGSVAGCVCWRVAQLASCVAGCHTLLRCELREERCRRMETRGPRRQSAAAVRLLHSTVGRFGTRYVAIDRFFWLAAAHFATRYGLVSAESGRLGPRRRRPGAAAAL